MPVQGLSRDAELLAQVADLSFSLPHCRHRQAQLGGGHLERPTTFPTARPRRGQARYCALCDQLALEFGQCGEDAEDQFASSGRRVDGRTVAAQHLETDATPSQIVHGVDQVPKVAPEPVASLCMGVVGIFVPGLPTTVFILIAGACAARSSERLHGWLWRHRH